MGTDLDKAIGARVRFFRKNAGYTQAQLAELAECETATIGRCENGKDRISLTLLSRISDKLNVDLYKFFTPRIFENDAITIKAISKMLMSADKTQLGLIYKIVSNILDLT